MWPFSHIHNSVRVRFAPSPTGSLHIGGLRTALYNYLFVRKHGGVFVLRIEDTDRARSVPGGVENILSTLEWCGLEYDEGPVLHNPSQPPLTLRGGDERIPPLRVRGGAGELRIVEKGKYGPYVQSQRLEIYKKHAEQLVGKGRAYYCVCTPERLEELRKEQMAARQPTKYDGRCRNLAVSRKPSAVGAHVVRLKVPEQGSTKFTDVIRGEVKFENALIDDQVLLKSDGYPTYHLANVVDDHLMKITHVIRGEEWLPSTPKHVLLYKAFGWKPPQFAHLPLLLNSDHSKLSKRQGDVAVEDYIKKGYLREALINFVALLGWNPRADQELYTMEELIAEFDLAKVNKSGAVVNFEKLDWLNGHYIRQLDIDKLVELCIPYLCGPPLNLPLTPTPLPKGEGRVRVKGEKIGVDLRQIIALEQERLVKLSDIVVATEFFFVDQPRYEPELLMWKKMRKADVVRNLTELLGFLVEIYGGSASEPPEAEPRDIRWDTFTLEREIKTWITKTDRGVGETLWPMRVALSGRTASPPPFDIAAILGKEKTLKRIEYAIELAKKS